MQLPSYINMTMASFSISHSSCFEPISSLSGTVSKFASFVQLQCIFMDRTGFFHHAAISVQHAQCTTYSFCLVHTAFHENIDPLLIPQSLASCHYDSIMVIKLFLVCSTDVKLQLSPPLHDCCCAEDVLKSKECISQ